MAVPSYISASALGSSGNVGPTTGIDTTGATALRVVVITQQSATPTVTDSKTNTWTTDRAAVLLSSGFTGYVHFLKATTNNVGTGHTFSATGTSACSIWAIAVGPSAGGSLTLTAFDAIATTSSPYTSNSVTPANADALLIAFGASDGAGSPVTTDWSGSSFTGRAEVTDHNNFWGGSIATRAVTSSAAYTASFTDNSSSPTNAVIAILAVTESGADTTAPTLTSPTGTATGSTTAQGQVSTDEANGTMYAVVSTSATPPSVAQIQAGNDSTGSAGAWSGNQSITTTGTKTFNATGLTASTGYYFYFQHRDAAANDSTVAASSQFTTNAPTVDNAVAWIRA